VTNDLERFSQGLQDLIYIREKLSSELADELKRSESLATAVAGLRRLNDASQSIIEDTLYRIGVWKDEAEAPDHETAQVMQADITYAKAAARDAAVLDARCKATRGPSAELVMVGTNGDYACRVMAK